VCACHGSLKGLFEFFTGTEDGSVAIVGVDKDLVRSRGRNEQKTTSCAGGVDTMATGCVGVARAGCSPGSFVMWCCRLGSDDVSLC
jgi:hypothetical protein